MEGQDLHLVWTDIAGYFKLQLVSSVAGAGGFVFMIDECLNMTTKSEHVDFPFSFRQNFSYGSFYATTCFQVLLVI